MQEAESPKYAIGGGSFSIQLMKRKGVTAMPRPHSHRSIELYYLISGERIYFIEDQVVTVREGDLIVIAPGELHATASSQVAEFERFLLHVEPEFLDPSLSVEPLLAPSGRFRLIRLSFKEQDEVRRLLAQMQDECRLGRLHYELCVRSLLAELLILLHRTEPQRADPADRHPLFAKISEIATYLREHAREPLTLEATANRFYISASYLSRIFYRFTGFHFREYVTVVRIREAQRLLAETQLQVQEVAGKMGFEHMSHFNRTFKRIAGITPLQYRKRSARD